MSTLTMKFGGTSVGSVEAHTQAADIVLEQSQRWDRLAVVVSAMSGTTDALIRGARTAAAGDDQTYRAIAADLRVRHYRAVDELLTPDGERAEMLAAVDECLDEFTVFCRSIHVLGEVTPRAMDAIASLGERINARITAAVLRRRGLKSEAVDATELIVTDDKFQNAMPLMDATRDRVSDRLVPLLEDGVVPVVTGFIGTTEGGVTTTLGRGGSDYTAAILADCLDADEVWTWTDVDGVMSADPRMVPDARVIPVLVQRGERTGLLWGQSLASPDHLAGRRARYPAVGQEHVQSHLSWDPRRPRARGRVRHRQGRYRDSEAEHGDGRRAGDAGRARHRRPYLRRRRQPGGQRVDDLPGFVGTVHLLRHPHAGGTAGDRCH